MDKPVLIVEMPELSDTAIVSIHLFLQKLLDAFESHYFCKQEEFFDDKIEDSF